MQLWKFIPAISWCKSASFPFLNIDPINIFKSDTCSRTPCQLLIFSAAVILVFSSGSVCFIKSFYVLTQMFELLLKAE